MNLKASRQNNIITLQGKNHTIMEFPIEEFDLNWNNIKNMALINGFLNYETDKISINTHSCISTKNELLNNLYKEDTQLLLNEYHILYPTDQSRENKYGIVLKEDQSIDYAVIIRNHDVYIYNSENIVLMNLNKHYATGDMYFMLKRLLTERVDLLSIAQIPFQNGLCFLFDDHNIALHCGSLPYRFTNKIEMIFPLEKILALMTEPFINETKEEATATISYFPQERINEVIISVHPEAVIPVSPRTICAPLPGVPNAAPPIPPIPQTTEPLVPTIQASTIIPSSITITNKEQIADEEEFDLPF